MNAAASPPTAGVGELCGLVVIYQPEPEVEGNLQAMAAECGRLLVLDNGSSADFAARVGALRGAERIELAGNHGVAAALNRGLARARELGCRWVVTFDQDSRPTPGLVAALCARRDALPGCGVVGAAIEEPATAGSSYRWVRRHPLVPFFFQRAAADRALEDVTMVVTSGSLIDVELADRLGDFDGGLFIDYVDIDFCLKVRRAGRRVAVAPAAILRHRLGARSARVLWGRDFRPMNHAPFRHFYMARNRVLVWRRHAGAVPHWAAFDFCFATYNLLRVLFFEDQRGAKLRAMLRGTWHGLRGRRGPMP